MSGGPPAADAQPAGRAAPLRLERLQQLLWRRLQEKEPADSSVAHFLPDLRGGRGNGPQSSADPQGAFLTPNPAGETD